MPHLLLNTTRVPNCDLSRAATLQDLVQVQMAHSKCFEARNLSVFVALPPLYQYLENVWFAFNVMAILKGNELINEDSEKILNYSLE